MKTHRLPGHGRLLVVAALVTVLPCAGAWAIDTLGPRAYQNGPVGADTAFLQYQHVSGTLSFQGDLPLPVGAVDAAADIYALSFIKWFDVGGHDAFVTAAVPYADIRVSLPGTDMRRSASGLADPIFWLGYSFSGAPALRLPDYMQYTQDLIFSGSLAVSVPLGHYHEDRVLNTGSNRWIFKPELAVSAARDDWVYEAYGNVQFYQDNDDYFGDTTFAQSELWGLEAHISRNLKYADGMPVIWASFDAFYANGGETSVGGGPESAGQDDVALGLGVYLTKSLRDRLYINYRQDVHVADEQPKSDMWTIRYDRFAF